MSMRSPFYGFFTFTLAGLFLVITGAIGWVPVKSGGVFSGGRWVDGPVWSQVGFGLACLAVAAIAFCFVLRDPRLRAARSAGR
jgi:hypothetical protein